MRWHARRGAAAVAAVLTLGYSSACATEQEREDAAATVDVAQTVPPGTSLVFSVDERVSTATHARGDVFSATLRHDVADGDGSEAIPEGVPSQWVIAEAVTEHGETVLAVRLESIRVNGTWTPVVADVTEAHLRESNGATVAVGSAAVELLGEEVPLAGTEPGAFVTLTTQGGSAILPAGSAITVLLTEPLEV